MFFESLIVALLKNIFSCGIFNITKACMGQYWENKLALFLSFCTMADTHAGMHLIDIYVRTIIVWKIVVSLI